MTEFIESVVSVPVWLIVSLGLIGTLLGALIAIAGALASQRGEESGNKKGYRKNAVDTVLKHLEEVNSDASTPTFKSYALAVPPEELAEMQNKPKEKPKVPQTNDRYGQMRVTEEGLTELERRTTQRINYRVGEAATLLGIETNQVGKLLQDGNLKSLVTGDGTRWIIAESITNMLSRIGVKREEPEEESEEKPETEAPLSVNGTPRYKLPYQQHYWYYVDGDEKGVPSLRDALKKMGIPVKDKVPLDWRDIPSDTRARISRVEVQGTNQGTDAASTAAPES